MSLANEIRILYEPGDKTTTEIAEIVGCSKEYVRVCARQRGTFGRSAIDDRYYDKFVDNHGCAPDTHRYRSDPEYRKRRQQQVNARRRERRATDPEFRARERQYQRDWLARKRKAAIVRLLARRFIGGRIVELLDA